MRHIARSLVIGSLAIAATALAGVQTNSGGIAASNAGQTGALDPREAGPPATLTPLGRKLLGLDAWQ